MTSLCAVCPGWWSRGWAGLNYRSMLSWLAQRRIYSYSSKTRWHICQRSVQTDTSSRAGRRVHCGFVYRSCGSLRRRMKTSSLYLPSRRRQKWSLTVLFACCININYWTELSADKHATTTVLVLSAEISHLHFSCIVFFGCHFIDFIPLFLATCLQDGQ